MTIAPGSWAFRLTGALSLLWLTSALLIGCGDGKKKPTSPSIAAACESDSDCKTGRCDPLHGCAECLFDSDCAAQARCHAQQCHPLAACSTNADCESGSCDTKTSLCAECTTNAQCAKGERCSEGFCGKSFPCGSSSDCEPGTVCDQKSEQCVECASSSDCAAGASCQEGQCLPACSKDKDCPSVYYCFKGVCTLDACDAGSTSCSASGGGTLTCSRNGDGFDLSPCPRGQACQQTDGEPRCLDRLCTAGQWSCDAAWTTASLCSLDGLSFARTLDCAADGKVCDEGHCVERACEPSQRRCLNGAVTICSESGAQETSEPCDSGERCDPETVECVAQACTPGVGGCVAETIASCRDDGSGFEPNGKDCAASQQACWDGNCLSVICAEGFTCQDGASYECTDHRTHLRLSESCDFAAKRFCNNESGKCQDFVCEPGQPTCNGDLATSCADDGSHPSDFGVDCTASGKVCWAAACLTAICEPGSYSCEGADLKQCVNKGTAWRLVQSCGEGTVCDATAGACRLQKCAPNQPACDGEVATTCNDAGLGYVGSREDCSATSDVCVSGQCKPVICSPNATFCSQSELRQCGPNGGSYDVLATCLPSEFCDAAQSACKPDVCAAGSPVCNQNLLTTCNSDGSGPLPGGTDCTATNQVCDRGGCRTVVCTPNDLLCDAGNVALCNSAGTDWAPYDTCLAREFCDDSAPDATCAPDLCLQSGNGCSSERLATCNANGSGFASLGQDCAASAKVCDLSGVCAATAVDDLTLGNAASPSAGSAIHFELFRVLTGRELTQLAAPIVQDGTDPITWLYYRSTTKLGTFTLVDQKSTAAPAAAELASSGPLSFAVKPGEFYLLGVAVKGPHTAGQVEGNAPQPVSFGQVLGGFTYVAGATPTIPAQVLVSEAILHDDVALRIHSAAP